MSYRVLEACSKTSLSQIRFEHKMTCSAEIIFKSPTMFYIVTAAAWHKQFCPRAWTGVVVAEDSDDTCPPGRALDLVRGCVRDCVCTQEC